MFVSTLFESTGTLIQAVARLAGVSAEIKRDWLAEVIVAVLQRAQELGLADWAAQRAPQGLAVPEGLAWRDCFAAFFELLARHLRTLAEVCRLAVKVSPLLGSFGALMYSGYNRSLLSWDSRGSYAL